MIVGGNEVYLLTLPWDTVSLLGDQCPSSWVGEGWAAGRAGSQAAGWRKPSTLGSSDAVTQEVPAGPAETERDVTPDALAMSSHTETWAIIPQRLKRTEVIDIATSGS